VKLHTKLVEVVDDRATGEDARKYRENKGVSLRSVAKQMGISAPYLSDLELGRRNWSQTLLVRFKDAVQALTDRYALTQDGGTES
jgi:transcriptional regulator with XRE-family HTH domain